MIPLVFTEESRLAYLAGFFDGEGCITVPHHVKDGIRRPTSLRITATGVDKRPLEMLRSEFGGNEQMYNDIRKAGYQRIYQWTLDASKAVSALKAMLPYLSVKREQAKLGIMYQGLVRPSGFSVINNPISEDEWARRRELASTLSAIKRIS